MLLNLLEQIKEFVSLLGKLLMMLLKILTEMRRGFDIQGEQENDDVTEDICQNNDDMMKMMTIMKYITVEHPFNLYNLLYPTNY